MVAPIKLLPLPKKYFPKYLINNFPTKDCHYSLKNFDKDILSFFESHNIFSKILLVTFLPPRRKNLFDFRQEIYFYKIYMRIDICKNFFSKYSLEYLRKINFPKTFQKKLVFFVKFDQKSRKISCFFAKKSVKNR